MIGRIVLLTAMLCASLASAAQPQQITVWKLDAGYYIVSGSQILAFPPEGPVVPPDDPVVPPSTPFAQAVTAAVNQIPATDKRHQSAMKLAATYQMLAGQVKDGKIHPSNAVQAAELICPIALGSEKAAWSGVFSVVNAEVGKAGTPEATAEVFTTAADVILASVPAIGDGDMQAAAQRYGFDWDKFMSYLMQLLQVLLPLIVS